MFVDSIFFLFYDNILNWIIMGYGLVQEMFWLEIYDFFLKDDYGIVICYYLFSLEEVLYWVGRGY